MKLIQALTFASVVTASAVDMRDMTPAKAVYIMSNKGKSTGIQNMIHALPVDSKGMLSHGTVTPTGGHGGKIPSSIGLTDALDSQGSLQVMGDMLIACNAASSTISLFKIDSEDPTKLQLIGKPVDSMGDFPVSIAASDELKMACVANTGTKAGVACFKVTSKGLMPMDKYQRPLPLDPMQSMPPKGPFNTISQVLFDYENQGLMVMVKGNPAGKPVTFGYMSYFPIENGKVSRRAISSSPKGSEVLFGSVALPDNKVFATDAAFGGVFLQLSEDNVASTLKKTVVPNQSATCWSIYGCGTGLVYTTDAGRNDIVAYSSKTGEKLGTTELKNGNSGMIEVRSAADKLYALSGGNSTVKPRIVVMQASNMDGTVKAMQNFGPSGVGLQVDGVALYK